jgi:hypothetical protein
LASSQEEADMAPSRQQMPHRRRQILQDEAPDGGPFNADVDRGHLDDTRVSFMARLSELIRKIGGRTRDDTIGGSDR